MKIIISETKLTKVLHTYLTMSFEGFEDCTYDWANFNCGMGVCCDQYAIGFVLPKSDYDDYLFKLADSKNYDEDGDYPEDLKSDLPEPCYNPPNINDPSFDTIVISSELYERVYDLFGDIDIWRESLLSVINKVFNINAHSLLYQYE